MTRISLTLSVVAASIVLGACTTDQIMMQRRVDYRSGSDNLSKNSLEVPPDLTAPDSTAQYKLPPKATLGTTETKVEQPATSTAATTTAAKARLVEAGGQRWLVVEGDPARIWPEVREFWLNQGFLLKIDNPSIGIMETDWLENRGDLPADWVTKMLRKVADSFISTGMLDKYRTRIEPGQQQGTTEIYISHRGREEVFPDGSKDGRALSDAAETKTYWVPRESDPELEAEMLSLMLQQLGLSPEEAQAVVKPKIQPKARAALVDNGVQLDDTFDRAWRRTGLALDRIGYVVVDRNRSTGMYYVRQADTDIAEEKKDGFFNNWFGGDKNGKKAPPKELEVELKQQTQGTRLTVAGKDGATLDDDTRQALLSALQSQLR
ncbi:outer membrane protein assembly factor BamC [Chitinibacteraceae bacterium HSL-7]